MSLRIMPLVIVAFVALAQVAGLRAQESVDEQIRENQERLNQIRTERNRLERSLQSLRDRAHDVSAELDNLFRQKNTTSQLVNELDRQIGGLTLQLDTVTADLTLAQDELAEKRAVLDRRLSDIYKRGPLWTFQVLISAQSFGDLLSRYKYLFLVSRQDRALVSEVEELRDQIALQRGQLLRLRNQLARSRSERGLELTRFNRLENRTQLRLREIEQNRRRTAQRIETLERDEDRVNATINELIASRADAASAADASIRAGDLGTLDWPADGPLAYRFGQYSGPNNTVLRRDGIGIRVDPGSPVRAVAQGQVIYARPLGTYGPTVIVEHGGDFYTLYHHLSRIDVGLGAKVERGQILGRSGGEGSEVGPHVGFQIRQGQLRLDPLNWLRSRS